MQHIRVMTVDDCVMIREIIMLLLNGNPDMDCVAQAESGSDAFVELERDAIDVVTLDLELPDMDGIAMIGAIKRVRRCGVIVVSGNSDRHLIALAAGASACFDKSDLLASRVVFADAIRTAWQESRIDRTDPDVVRKSA